MPGDKASRGGNNKVGEFNTEFNTEYYALFIYSFIMQARRISLIKIKLLMKFALGSFEGSH